jgi:hypothetical protein
MKDMKAGTQDVVQGERFHCDKDGCEFNLFVAELLDTLICVDHFGAHVTGNAKTMRHTMEVSGR